MDYSIYTNIKKPNIKVPEGYELFFNTITNHWSLRLDKSYTATRVVKNHYVPTRRENGELFTETKYVSKGKNANLHNAKRVKNDEYYTSLQEVINECKHYKEFFVGKTIYCPCDKAHNEGRSNFFEYFVSNFKELGLKKIIASQYNPNIGEHGIAWVYEGGLDESHFIDESEVGSYLLNGDGDFRSAECKAFMKECDIVVTNPPFSLFRDFVGQIMDFGKKFLIIGSQDAISYKEIFPLLKDGKMWLGYNTPKIFETDLDMVIDEKKQFEEDGKIYQKFGNICWYTNLPHHKRTSEELALSRYVESKYPHYDNYDAIEVGKVKDIPDYDGVMGVPLSFFLGYNPNQFEIIGLDRYVEDNPKYGHRFTIQGKETYARILIRKK